MEHVTLFETEQGDYLHIQSDYSLLRYDLPSDWRDKAKGYETIEMAIVDTLKPEGAQAQ